MTAPVRSRPALVTVLLVLVLLGGIGWIVTGIVAISTYGGINVAGIFAIILGLIYFAVAKGLANGNSIARIIVTIVAVLQVAWAIFDLVAANNAGNRNSAVVSGVVGLLILLVLFMPATNAWIRSRNH
ncbi:MAG: hypothetical protein ACR2P2_03430 [Nakamurella sp.]